MATVQHVQSAYRSEAATEVRCSTVLRRAPALLVLAEQREVEGRLLLGRRGRRHAAFTADVHLVVPDRQNHWHRVAFWRDQGLGDVLEPRSPARPPGDEPVGVGEIAPNGQQVGRLPCSLGQQGEREGLGAYVPASRNPDRALERDGAEAADRSRGTSVEQDLEVVAGARLQAVKREPIHAHVRNPADLHRFARNRQRLRLRPGQPPLDACRPWKPLAHPIRFDDQIDRHRRRRVALPRQMDGVPRRLGRRTGTSGGDARCEDEGR